jgi:hypothetical protein
LTDCVILATTELILFYLLLVVGEFCDVFFQ